MEWTLISAFTPRGLNNPGKQRMKKLLLCLVLALCPFVAQARDDYDRVGTVTLNGRDALESVNIMALPASFWQENTVMEIVESECPGPTYVKLAGSGSNQITLDISEDEQILRKLFSPKFKGYGKGPLHGRLWRLWNSMDALRKSKDDLRLDGWSVAGAMAEAEFQKRFPNSGKHPLEIEPSPPFSMQALGTNYAWDGQKTLRRYWVQIGRIHDDGNDQLPGYLPGVFFVFCEGTLIRVWYEGFGTQC